MANLLPPLYPSGERPYLGLGQRFSPGLIGRNVTSPGLSPSVPWGLPFVNEPSTRERLEAIGLDPDTPEGRLYAARNALPVGQQPSTGIGGDITAFGAGLGRSVANTVLGIADLPLALLRGAGVGAPRIPALGETQVEQVNPVPGALGSLVGTIGQFMLGEAALAKLAKGTTALGELAAKGGVVGRFGRGARMATAFGVQAALQPGDIEDRFRAAMHSAPSGFVLGAAGAPAFVPPALRIPWGGAASYVAFGGEPIVPTEAIPPWMQHLMLGGGFEALGYGEAAREYRKWKQDRLFAEVAKRLPEARRKRGPRVTRLKPLTWVEEKTAAAEYRKPVQTPLDAWKAERRDTLERNVGELDARRRSALEFLQNDFALSVLTPEQRRVLESLLKSEGEWTVDDVLLVESFARSAMEKLREGLETSVSLETTETPPETAERGTESADASGRRLRTADEAAPSEREEAYRLINDYGEAGRTFVRAQLGIDPDTLVPPGETSPVVRPSPDVDLDARPDNTREFRSADEAVSFHEDPQTGVVTLYEPDGTPRRYYRKRRMTARGSFTKGLPRRGKAPATEGGRLRGKVITLDSRGRVISERDTPYVEPPWYRDARGTERPTEAPQDVGFHPASQVTLYDENGNPVSVEIAPAVENPMVGSEYPRLLGHVVTAGEGPYFGNTSPWPRRTSTGTWARPERLRRGRQEPPTEPPDLPPSEPPTEPPGGGEPPAEPPPAGPPTEPPGGGETPPPPPEEPPATPPPAEPPVTGEGPTGAETPGEQPPAAVTPGEFPDVDASPTAALYVMTGSSLPDGMKEPYTRAEVLDRIASELEQSGSTLHPLTIEALRDVLSVDLGSGTPEEVRRAAEELRRQVNVEDVREEFIKRHEYKALGSRADEAVSRLGSGKIYVTEENLHDVFEVVTALNRVLRGEVPDYETAARYARVLARLVRPDGKVGKDGIASLRRAIRRFLDKPSEKTAQELVKQNGQVAPYAEALGVSGEELLSRYGRYRRQAMEEVFPPTEENIRNWLAETARERVDYYQDKQTGTSIPYFYKSAQNVSKIDPEKNPSDFFGGIRVFLRKMLHTGASVREASHFLAVLRQSLSRNPYRAAKVVFEELDGILPRTREDLKRALDEVDEAYRSGDSKKTDATLLKRVYHRLEQLEGAASEGKLSGGVEPPPETPTAGQPAPTIRDEVLLHRATLEEILGERGEDLHRQPISRQEFSSLSKEHADFLSFLEKYAKKMRLPEEFVDLAIQVLRDVPADALSGISYEVNLRRRGGVAFPGEQKLMLGKTRVQHAAWITLHELGHLLHYFVLTKPELETVRRIYDKLGRKGRIEYLKQLGYSESQARYLAKNPTEFFTGSFTAYMLDRNAADFIRRGTTGMALFIRKTARAITRAVYNLLGKLIDKNSPEEFPQPEHLVEMAKIFERVLQEGKLERTRTEALRLRRTTRLFRNRRGVKKDPYREAARAAEKQERALRRGDTETANRIALSTSHLVEKREVYRRPTLRDVFEKRMEEFNRALRDLCASL